MIDNNFVQKLPIYVHKSSILKDILSNTCTILLSDTGSGKSTLVPFFLCSNQHLQNKRVLITQPRRIAVRSLYDFVSKLTDDKSYIGYQMRFYQNFDDEKNRLLFVTDGILLIEASRDPYLSKFDVIIIDEAHERRLNTDIILGVLKRAILYRNKLQHNPLKVVIMSATIDPKIFYDFFASVCTTKVLYLSVKSHPLDIRFLTETVTNYVSSACDTVIQHHITERESNFGIIVFMPGEDEIIRTCKLLRQKIDLKRLSDTFLPDLEIMILHGSLPIVDQNNVINFIPADNKRKVIISTNIAETSLTIPNVNCVVDCGFHNTIKNDPITSLESLTVQKISQSQAWQRAGRANRVGPGICYFLYTQDDFQSRSLTVKPELFNCDLSSVILNLTAQNITNVHDFPWISKPNQNSIQAAINNLGRINAIHVNDHRLSLTEEGTMMSQIPVNPKFAYSVLEGVKFNCYSSMLSLVSILSVMPVFFNSNLVNKEILEGNDFDAERINKNILKQARSCHYGDISRLLNIHKEYKVLNTKFKDKKVKIKKWCLGNNLIMNRLDEARKIRAQLHKRMKVIVRRYKKSRAILEDGEKENKVQNIINCLTSSVFQDQIVTLKKTSTNGLKHTTSAKKAVYESCRHPDLPFHIHPDSVLYEYDEAPQKIIFLESSYEQGTNRNDAKVLMRVCSPIL